MNKITAVVYIRYMVKSMILIAVNQLQKIADYYLETGKEAQYYKIKQILDILDELYFS